MEKKDTIPEPVEGAFIDVDEAPPTVDDGSPKSYRILDYDPTEVKSYK